jgi:hypothetical protein
MGKHFDALVDLIKNNIINDDDRFKADRKSMESLSVKQYLGRLVKKAALFDFPLNSEEIFPKSGKDFSEYVKYVQDYFDLSQQNGIFMLMPFQNTAIEDKVSVVFFDNLEDNEYRITACNTGPPPVGPGTNLTTLIIGDTALKKPDINFEFKMKTIILFDTSIKDGVRIDHNNLLYHTTVPKDLATATASYIEQLIYIMDPENFIIRKENNASISQKKFIGQKGKKNKKGISYKTIMRPHYICLSEEGVKEFLQNESKEPRPAHAVRGHWRRLMSEKFVNKKGQIISISQYWTGEGKVEGKNGWNYEVYIKEGPTVIKPYSKTQ